MTVRARGSALLAQGAASASGIAGLARLAGVQAASAALPRVRTASPGADARRAAEVLLAADVVSFDVFDTLVSRVLDRPEDVHDLVERLAIAEGIPVPDGWRSMRSAAEAHARRVSSAPDVTLAEIYGACDGLLDGSTLRALQRLEVEAELRVAVPTARGRDLYRRARAADRTVVICSDMYLPKAAVERILRSCGYEGWDLLLVSAEDGVSKRDGSAFAALRERYEGRTLAHVGDNLESDVRAARRAGVKAAHLPSPADRAVRRAICGPFAEPAVDGTDPLAASLARGLFVRWFEHEGADSDAFGQVGRGVLGPVLLGFTAALEERARAVRATKLHFLAREGRVLLRAYEAAVPADERLPVSYALLSSRVTSMTAMTSEVSEENLRFLTKTPVKLPARSFLVRVLGEEHEAAVLDGLAAVGLDPAAPLGQDEAFVVLAPVFRRFAVELGSIADEQRALLIDYLAAIGLLGPTEHPLLVDVGWSGTIQRALARVRPGALDGFYLGLLDDVRTRSTPGLHGWLDARAGGGEAAELQVLFDNLRLLEVLFAAPDEGSVRAFAAARDDDGQPRVDRLPLEFPPEVRRSIDAAQDEAVASVSEFRATWARLGLDRATSVGGMGRAALRRLLETPSGRQLHEFGTLPFDGSYGERPGRVGLWGEPAAVLRRFDPGRLARGVSRRLARAAARATARR